MGLCLQIHFAALAEKLHHRRGGEWPRRWAAGQQRGAGSRS